MVMGWLLTRRRWIECAKSSQMFRKAEVTRTSLPFTRLFRICHTGTPADRQRWIPTRTHILEACLLQLGQLGWDRLHFSKLQSTKGIRGCHWNSCHRLWLWEESEKLLHGSLRTRFLVSILSCWLERKPLCSWCLSATKAWPIDPKKNLHLAQSARLFNFFYDLPLASLLGAKHFGNSGNL